MKIMFDAGHGYNTPGKRSPDGLREWYVNDKIVDELIRLAAGYYNLTVYRSDDPTGSTDVSLTARTNKANALNVDAFVSIHQNAYGSGGWNDVRGVETFAYISRPAGAVKLANNVQSSILKSISTSNRGVKYADFHVLRETKMDAILVECGFMTNKEDAAKMKSITWIRAMAAAIMHGIAITYGLKKKPAPAPAPTPKPAATTSGSAVHRVIVDGKQVGAYAGDEAIANLVKSHLAKNPGKIVIELVK